MLKNFSQKKVSKEKKQYFCELCDYKCDRKFLMKQHESTKKHQRAYNAQKCSKKYARHLCSCGRSYKHIQSYHRHVKTCKDQKHNDIIEKTNDNSNNEELKNIITTLIQQNQSILLENTEMRKMVKDIIPKIGNNITNINTQFNIKVFLNETCKDALNLTDFVNTLKLEIDDLNNTRNTGYVNGIANIFLKGLSALDVHERPIHCSDLKREVIYVKDNNIWEKEEESKPKIRSAISTITKKQINAIKEWENENYGWQKTDKGVNEYCELVKEVTAQGDDTDNKIIKCIAKNVIITK